MRLLAALLSALLIPAVLPCPAADKGPVITVADNGSIIRTVSCSDGHVLSGSFTMAKTGKEFVRRGSDEFSFLADGKRYSGRSNWRDIKTSTGGESVISMKSEDGGLTVELTYTSYPGLALVRKEICITNTGGKDVCIEGVNVEDIGYAFDCTHSQIYQSYGRFQTLGPYRGNWDDPLLVLYSPREEGGLAIGNEAIGVLKRTSDFEDGQSICVGTPLPGQD